MKKKKKNKVRIKEEKKTKKESANPKAGEEIEKKLFGSGRA